MKKRVFYHGTTIDRLPSILEHGICWLPSSNQVWDCSSSEVYAWDAKHCASDNDIECIEEAGFNAAYDSATCAAALCRVSPLQLVVIRIELEHEEDNHERILTDHSAQNMNTSAARIISDGIAVSEITDVYISQEVTLFRAFWLGSMYGRDLFASHTLEEYEIQVAEAMKGVYNDDIMSPECFKWEHRKINNRTVNKTKAIAYAV